MRYSLIVIFALLAFVSANAENKTVKPIKSWNGSLDDAKLSKLAPTTNYINTAKEFDKLWEGWKLGKEKPKIDFTKQLVVLGTTSGGRGNLRITISEKGDLKVLFFGTRDFRPGFRYEIAIISAEGIKSINGKEYKRKEID